MKVSKLKKKHLLDDAVVKTAAKLCKEKISAYTKDVEEVLKHDDVGSNDKCTHDSLKRPKGYSLFFANGPHFLFSFDIYFVSF